MATHKNYYPQTQVVFAADEKPIGFIMLKRSNWRTYLVCMKNENGLTVIKDTNSYLEAQIIYDFMVSKTQVSNSDRTGLIDFHSVGSPRSQ